MSAVLLFAVGFAAGLFGGMGMGGGTILIPALTLLLGVEQRVAQAVNVLSFIPMAAFALAEHKKNGLLKTERTLYIIIPALLAAVVSGTVMVFLPATSLRRAFGVFLIALAVKESFSAVSKLRGNKK